MLLALLIFNLGFENVFYEGCITVIIENFLNKKFHETINKELIAHSLHKFQVYLH